MFESSQFIVLFGPPLAGKGTIVQAVGLSRAERVRSLEVSSNTDFGVVKHHALLVSCTDRTETQLYVATLPGGVWGTDPWCELLRRACAIVLVLDSQRTRATENAESIEVLDGLEQVPNVGCVVMSKGDLVRASTSTSYARLSSSPFSAWPVFHTRHDSPATLLRPIEWILGQFSNS